LKASSQSEIPESEFFKVRLKNVTFLEVGFLKVSFFKKQDLESDFLKASSRKQVLESKFSKASFRKRVLESEFLKASISQASFWQVSFSQVRKMVS
jgi:uncharacterized protein YjbI with pentapeptide repeats